MSDLFDSNTNALPFETLVSRGVPTSKYMLWRQILLQVKHINKVAQIECDYNLMVDLPTGDKLNLNIESSKEIYNKLVTLLCEVPPSVAKYSSVFPQFELSMTKTMFLIPMKCVNNNQIQDSQFQILHRYLPTNKLLFKMEKIATMSCTLCNLYPESIVHLFYNCVSVKGLWMYVETLVEKLESRPIKLTAQDITLGFGLHLNRPSAYTDVNKLILYAKYYVWICRKKYEKCMR